MAPKPIFEKQGLCADRNYTQEQVQLKEQQLNEMAINVNVIGLRQASW